MDRDVAPLLKLRDQVAPKTQFVKRIGHTTFKHSWRNKKMNAGLEGGIVFPSYLL